MDTLLLEENTHFIRVKRKHKIPKRNVLLSSSLFYRCKLIGNRIMSLPSYDGGEIYYVFETNTSKI